jgi:hypothetical protein
MRARASLSSLSHRQPGPTCWSMLPPGTVPAAHRSASPLPLCSAGRARTAHVTRTRRFQVAVGRDPPCPCLVSSTCRPRCPTPTDAPSAASPPPPLLKRAPHRRPNSLSPAPRFSPLRSDAASPPPPSPPPQATGPPCCSPEPSHPCHRPQPLRRRRRSNLSRRAAARVSPAPFPLADAFAVE